MRREHRKPLPDEAVLVLKELHQITDRYELAFPAQGNHKCQLSENTLNLALRRMGFEKHEATSHGFRASASTLLNESGLWSPDAIEAELLHVGDNAVRAAYHRGQHWDERVRMASWWANEIQRLKD
jgi:integrase